MVAIALTPASVWKFLFK